MLQLKEKVDFLFCHAIEVIPKKLHYRNEMKEFITLKEKVHYMMFEEGYSNHKKTEYDDIEKKMCSVDLEDFFGKHMKYIYAYFRQWRKNEEYSHSLNKVIDKCKVDDSFKRLPIKSIIEQNLNIIELNAEINNSEFELIRIKKIRTIFNELIKGNLDSKEEREKYTTLIEEVTDVYWQDNSEMSAIALHITFFMLSNTFFETLKIKNEADKWYKQEYYF